MKIICFSIVTIVGLCIAVIPFFKSGGDDIEEAGLISFLLLSIVAFIMVFSEYFFLLVSRRSNDERLEGEWAGRLRHLLLDSSRAVL